MTITVGLITKVITIIIIMVTIIIIIITIGDKITIITQTDHKTKAGIIHRNNIVELIMCRLTTTLVEGGTTSDETVLVEIEEM